MDETKPIREGMSFICGNVTRYASTDEAGFIDGYVANVRASRIVNGGSDLQKPTLAVCGQLPAGSPGKTDDDASGNKNADSGSNDDGGTAQGSSQPRGGATNVDN